MSRITFYTHVNNLTTFCCRLSARVLDKGNCILLWASDEATVAQLDKELWRYKASSFLAHEIWQPNQPCPHTVPLILAFGDNLPEIDPQWVVLNLSTQYWCHAPIRPKRVLEIIGSDIASLNEARQRFVTYRQQGFMIEHHNMQKKS